MTTTKKQTFYQGKHPRELDIFATVYKLSRAETIDMLIDERMQYLLAKGHPLPAAPSDEYVNKVPSKKPIKYGLDGVKTAFEVKDE